ncbi:PIG-L family deacetylase [Modicisalibacter sp. 'Wilcox']|uniref:PIG-L deacetylase family protein n=1 Tax=Modicisalibacter sp. 'Wilcox' TaxID=2679914 RepID=UPI0013D61DD6|nr:PIG-L family deacetylase [Modicisalibacter sp. 'Wilcox']
MRRRDDVYPFEADRRVEISLAADGSLTLPAGLPDAPAEWSWLLEVDYRPRRGLRQPRVTLASPAGQAVTHYLERKVAGRRWLNLTGITTWDALRVIAAHCRLGERAVLHGFAKPDLTRGPVLFVAPHPDDAELAGYGLYRRLAAHTWIVTLSAGETLKRLDRQYIAGLDASLAAARRRKGRIRAWNSATTPQLAGIPQERLIMLGYFNDTLDSLADPGRAAVPSNEDTLSPRAFRHWNRLALPSDADATNHGDHLLADLAFLVEHIRPATVVVTHPEIDPHRDHIAAAQGIARALQQTGHTPQRILLYANHLRGLKGFPPGPAHAGATLWPHAGAHSALGRWRFHGEVLSPEIQREKALSLDTMHDLRGSPGLMKRLKRRWRETLAGTHGPRYGGHDYFRSHVRAQEVFIEVSGEAFVAGLQAPRGP